LNTAKQTTSSTSSVEDSQYREAIQTVSATLENLRNCPQEELQRVQKDIDQLEQMYRKITDGRVEIVIFGEISTGKSALINALIGKQVAAVDVQGGWTKEVWGTAWEGTGYRLPGLESSELVLIDTPGINEVKGGERGELAEVTARQADLILFVCDSDLNQTEYIALLELASIQKPIILVLNKMDLYSPADQEQLVAVLKQRTAGIISGGQLVRTAADPRPVEYVTQLADGTEQSDWRKPEADVTELKSRILQVLEQEGLGLLALNAAMYAADKSDRISAIRVQMRNKQADQVIWTMAGTKALVVALNPVPVMDVLGGLAVDALMIVTLSRVYGLDFSMVQARDLAKAIAQAAGIFALGEVTNWGASLFKGLTVTLGTTLTLIPQGAAAGFTSYIVGQAAKRYFQMGGSWGAGSAKTVVNEILDATDRNSVLHHLKDEIRQKMRLNRHVEGN
jgi:small GTP-binding protein